MVGNGGSSNILLIRVGGQVANGGGGIIGNLPSSSNNIVVVGLNGARWTNSADLFVGGSGTGNQMAVTNGGQVFNANGSLLSSDNAVVVSGAGSLWMNRSNLTVGGFGGGNRLMITNRGLVVSTRAFLGAGLNSSSNELSIMGAASRFITTNFTFGQAGKFNQLIIADGGQLNSSNSIIGLDASSDTNAVLVSGLDSLWTNRASMLVGSNGSGNRLTITNGAAVLTANGAIGWGNGGDGNVVTVGSGSTWWTSGPLWVGLNGSENQLVVNAGNAGGGSGYVGFAGTNNHALITDTGALRVADLTVGGSGFGNRLTVTNAGQVVTTNSITLGLNAGSEANTVTVAGSLSTLTSDGDLTVGSFGVRNTLTIRDGGRVLNSIGNIGTRTVASNNAVVVSGPGSLWENVGAWLLVGEHGKGNSLTISNGGRVASLQGYLGVNAGADNNRVLVTGADSFWTNSTSLTVGYGSQGSRLDISNGGRVINQNGIIGLTASGRINTVAVEGAGSMWVNRLDLTVGAAGDNNQLIVRTGAVVSVGSSLMVGAGNLATNNSIVLYAGAGLSVTNEAQTGLLDVRRGSVFINGGVISTDLLVLTNGSESLLRFYGGTLQTGRTVISNTPGPLVVGLLGIGEEPPVLKLTGGVNSFGDGLIIETNATLRGCGTIHGTVINYGTIIADCGVLSFTGDFVNSGGAIYSTNGGSIDLFRITAITNAGTTVTVFFETVNGMTFTLDYKSASNDANWTPILPGLPGNGNVLSLTDANAAVPTRIYRVRAQ